MYLKHKAPDSRGFVFMQNNKTVLLIIPAINPQ